ncbi:MAG: hypothetical protein ACO3AT_06915 [Ilumatobacteraceae bacterium]|jgi:hypothetical protein
MRRRERPYLIVLAATAWVTRQFWWPGHYVVAFDTGTYATPNWIVSKEAFVDGRLPLIDDRIFGGVPHMGNPQTGTLSPLRWISYLLEPNQALNLLAAVHVAILGIGLVFLARRLNMSRTAATCAGLVAVFCGATTTKSVQVEQVMVIAWLPWILAFVVMVIAHPARRTYVGLLSLALSMAIVSGHPQMTYEVALTAAVFSVFLLIVSHERRRATAALATAVGVAVLTCALQLSSAIAATGDSYFSGGRDVAGLDNGALVLRARSVVQVFLGTVHRGRSDVFAGAFESIAYLGVVAVILTALAMFMALRERDTRPWAVPLTIVAVVGTVWSLGPRTPVFRLAFDFLPGFDQARVSTRWLVIVSLIAAVFVGHAVDVLRRHADTTLAKVVIATVTSGIVVLVLAPLDSGDGRTKLTWFATALMIVAAVVMAGRGNETTRRRSVTLVVAVLVIELIMLDRSSIIHDVASSVPVESTGMSTTEFLTSTEGYTLALTEDSGDFPYLLPALRPNANALFDVTSIDGYDGGVQVTKRWATSLERFSPTPAYDLPMRNSLVAPLEPSRMARLGVRWVLLDITDDPNVLVPDWEGPVASDQLFTVWENPAWIAPGWAFRAATTTDDAANDLRENFASLVNTALVDRDDATFDCTSLCEPLPVDLLAVDPEHLSATVEFDQTTLVTAPRQALPGWQVTVDGRAADVVVVDGLFLGVRVEPGPHVIDWRYRPGWVTPAVLASVLGVSIMLGLLWGRRPRWRRSTPGAPR